MIFFRDMTEKEYEQFYDVFGTSFFPLWFMAFKEIFTELLPEHDTYIAKILVAILAIFLLTFVLPPIYFVLKYKVWRYRNKYPERLI